MANLGEQLDQDYLQSGFDKSMTRLVKADEGFVGDYNVDDMMSHLENSHIHEQGWISDIAFTSDDYRTVSWGSGNLSYRDGKASPTIALGNTGAMASKTYIYYDPQAGQAALQTTTSYETATRGERLLLAVANPDAVTTKMAEIQTIGMSGSYPANLSVEHLTSGSIRSKTVTLAVADGTGDSYFNAGKTDFTNTQTGFILGIDDSDSNLAKFYIGSSSQYLNWTGSSLDIKGDITIDSGSGAGWTFSGTTISSGAGGIILDSSVPSITVADGDDKVVMTIAASVGYLDFYAGGALKGRVRGTTAANGGIKLTQGDFALANDYSILFEETTANQFGRISVAAADDSMWFVAPTNNELFSFRDAGEQQIMSLSPTTLFLGNTSGGANQRSLGLQFHTRGDLVPSTQETGILWVADGTGSYGGVGDLVYAVNIGGTTKYKILADYDVDMSPT